MMTNAVDILLTAPDVWNESILVSVGTDYNRDKGLDHGFMAPHRRSGAELLVIRAATLSQGQIKDGLRWTVTILSRRWSRAFGFEAELAIRDHARLTCEH
jgi:hypothetical protein